MHNPNLTIKIVACLLALTMTVNSTGMILFNAPTGFYMGDNTSHLAKLADVDQKNGMDVVVAEDNIIKIMLNHGNAYFSDSGERYYTESKILDFYVLDVDGKNGDDIVTRNYSNDLNHSSVSVFINNGFGKYTLTYEYILADRINAGSIKFTDLDNINGLDFVVSHSLNNVSVFFNNGDNSFSPITLDTIKQPIILGLFDTDLAYGKDIILFSNSNKKVEVWLNNDSGGFNLENTYDFETAEDKAYLFDFDGRDGLDILTRNTSTQMLRVLSNNADGSFTSISDIKHMPMPIYGLADINGENGEDIVGYNQEKELIFYKNLGNGNGFGSAEILNTVISGISSFEFFDIDGQNGLDIIVSNRYSYDNYSSSKSIYLNSGNGVFNSRQTLPYYGNFLFGDLNSNGINDLLVVGFNYFYPIISGDNGIFPSVDYELNENTRKIVSLDMDGEHHMDIAISYYNTENKFSILLSDGLDSFEPPQNYPTSFGTNRMQVGNMDNTGALDLAVEANGNSPLKYFVKGDGTFTENSGTLATSSSDIDRWILVDIDGKNGDDFVGHDYQSGKYVVVTRFNDGSGGFLSKKIAEIPNNDSPYDFIAGDFDNDGDIDVLYLEKKGSIGVMKNHNGELSFDSYVAEFSTTSMTSIRSLAVGDLDGVNGLDFVVSYSNRFYIFLNQGNGFNFTRIQQPESWARYPIPKIFIHDLDGINGPEIITTSGFSNGINVYINDGHANFKQSKSFLVSTTGHDFAMADLFESNGIDIAMTVKSSLTPTFLKNISTQTANYSIDNISDVDTATTVTTKVLEISNLTDITPISIKNGTLSINGSNFDTSVGLVENGDEVVFNVNTPNTHSSSIEYEVSLGEVFQTFVVTSKTAPAALPHDENEDKSKSTPSPTADTSNSSSTSGSSGGIINFPILFLLFVVTFVRRFSYYHFKPYCI